MVIKGKNKLVFRSSLLLLVTALIFSCDTTEPLFDKYTPSGTYSLNWDDAPKLGGDKDLRLGGFVGLFYKNNRTFFTITNRGPVVQQISETGATTNFVMPEFTPSIVELELQDNNNIKFVNQISLKRPDGNSVSGLLPPGKWVANEVITNSNILEDAWGIYPGGIYFDVANNYFWISDQYNPALLKVETNGTWVKRLRPNEGFRRVLANHTVNGGFTGVDFLGTEKLVTVNGRCLENNINVGEAASSMNFSMRRVSIYNFKANSDVSMIYNVEPRTHDGIPERFVQLGDIAAVNDTAFLVTEFADYNGVQRNLLYLATTNDSTTKAPIGLEGLLGKTIETLTPKERNDNNIVPMKKYLIYNLSSTKIKHPEGITILDENTIAIIDNNKFGLINGDPANGNFELDKNSIYLEIINLPVKLELKR